MCKIAFIAYAKQVGRDHPQLQDEIQDTFELALAEIADGEPEEHEWELAVDHIAELVKEL